jgi:hypothetical protein
LKSKFLASFCCLAIVCFFGCGQTYELQSIEVSPSSPNVVGIGGFQQLTVTARYSNSKSQDVTNRTAYKIDQPAFGAPFAPPEALTISISGRVQAVDGACTWTAFKTADTPPKVTYATNPYILTATFDKQESVSFVSVASAAGCESPDTASESAIIYNVPEQFQKYLPVK